MRVIVIGAGIIGLSTAEALARRGAEVVVLDARSVGRGASQASAGILAPYTEAGEDSPLLALGIRSLALFDDFVAGAAARSGRPIEYARTGTLDVAFTESACAHVQAALQWLEPQGVESRWLDQDALRDVAPAVSPHARGGLLIPSHGWVGVRSLLAALLQSARLAGARFESPVAVDAIRVKETVMIRAGDRRLEADAAVLASGSWSGRVRLDDVPALPLRPVRGQLLHLQWPGAPLPPIVIWGPDCYAVPWSDGTVLIGATVEEAGFDERATVDGVASLTRAATALLPGAADAAVAGTRVGLRPASPDGLPIIGAVPSMPGVFVATAHYRNGILLAPVTAELVTRMVLDGVAFPELDRFSPDRFPQGA